MPINFTGTLKANENFASIYNMIISQQVFADNIKGAFGSLVNDVKLMVLFTETQNYSIQLTF